MSSVCPSVHLSVRLVGPDRISWKSWKLIARTIFALRSRKAIHLLLGEHWEILERLEVAGAVEKSGVLEHKSGHISETRKDR